MLQNESEAAIQDTPAAKVRVKTEELAKAIAAIEARKQEQARLLEGTVAVGDAVKELRLEETPEEILAEVERQRAEPATEEVDSGKEGQDRLVYDDTWRNIGVGAMVLCLFLMIGWIITASRMAAQSSVRPQSSTTPYPASQGFYPHAPTAQEMLNMMPKRVSTIADGQPFELGWTSASQLLTGQDQSQLLDNGTMYLAPLGHRSSWHDAQSWNAIKYNGQTYFRGWTNHPVSASPESQQRITIFNIPEAVPSGQHPVQITLQVQVSQFVSLSENMFNPATRPFSTGQTADPITSPHSPAQDIQIVVSHVNLDKHAWEKW